MPAPGDEARKLRERLRLFQSRNPFIFLHSLLNEIEDITTFSLSSLLQVRVRSAGELVLLGETGAQLLGPKITALRTAMLECEGTSTSSAKRPTGLETL